LDSSQVDIVEIPEDKAVDNEKLIRKANLLLEDSTKVQGDIGV
jgi:hypothetical protein